MTPRIDARPRRSMLLVGGAAAAAAALLVVLTGCSVSTGPDSLPGTEIAKKANAELIRSNPDMVEGEHTCNKIDYEVDATSRCLRTVAVGNGQIVQIEATEVDAAEFNTNYEFRVVPD